MRAARRSVEFQPQLIDGLMYWVVQRRPPLGDPADARPGVVRGAGLGEKSRQSLRFAVVGEDALLQVYLILGVRQPALEPCAVHRRQDAGDRPQPRDRVSPDQLGRERGQHQFERVPQAPQGWCRALRRGCGHRR